MTKDSLQRLQINIQPREEEWRFEHRSDAIAHARRKQSGTVTNRKQEEEQESRGTRYARVCTCCTLHSIRQPPVQCPSLTFFVSSRRVHLVKCQTSSPRCLRAESCETRRAVERITCSQQPGKTRGDDRREKSRGESGKSMHPFFCHARIINIFRRIKDTPLPGPRETFFAPMNSSIVSNGARGASNTRDSAVTAAGSVGPTQGWSPTHMR